jgi:F0F1-type ATP synthase assembly protein I
VGLYVAVGFELPVWLVGSLLVGYWLDGYLNTSPWLLLLFGLLGFVSVWVRLLRWVKLFGERSERWRSDDRAG